MNKPALLFNIDESNGKVQHQCFVPKVEIISAFIVLSVQPCIDAGLKADEWAGVVCEKVGGKKGGKDQQAQGMGESVDKVDEAISVARDFAKLKLGTS